MLHKENYKKVHQSSKLKLQTFRVGSDPGGFVGGVDHTVAIDKRGQLQGRVHARCE